MNGNYQQGGYQQGGYQGGGYQGGGYQGGGGYPGGPQKNPGQGLGIASMVLGIVSLIIPFLGTACAIVGLILGVLSKKKSDAVGMPSGMAVAGIVCSIIALAISVLLLFTCWLPLCGLGCSTCGALGGMGGLSGYGGW